MLTWLNVRPMGFHPELNATVCTAVVWAAVLAAVALPEEDAGESALVPQPAMVSVRNMKA